MKKILIPTRLNSIAAELLRGTGDYEVIEDDETPLTDLLATHPDVFGLIVRSEPITQEVIDSLPDLKIIVRAGAGYNTIDTRHARRRRVDVMNTPGANANAVAELVISLILADARHLLPADHSTREGNWEKKRFLGRELTGKTVGILGLGHIGQLVAQRLAGFECRLLGKDPLISADRAKSLGVTLTDVDTIFEESDFISLHLPENDETRNMINQSLLSKLKDGATLINCARAGVLCEEDLREIKKDKNVRFLNDVYPKDEAGEKPIADVADIMLPHLGANTLEANINAARRAAEQLIEFEQKGVTSYIVNRDIPEGLDETYCDLSYTLARLARAMSGKDVSPTRMETSFYGSLQPYSPWLLVPIVAGLWEDFDRAMSESEAQLYLKDMGIEYVNRDPDPSKQYDNSITLDLIADVDSHTLNRTSVRGTVAEGIPMISRIGDFDRLYFEPAGHSAFFIYEDRPGVLGRVGNALAAAGINIEDARNPHNAESGRSLALLKVNQSVPQDVMNAAAEEIGAQIAFSIDL